ncbi:IS110 family transposase [Microbacterium aurantiacum]|uniref:IS110 family transposase n=1 Tax=Microbacterium aurantiacum TaxID=162393 RepID=UPI001F01501E|nr:IS110 family transposase [Microbacterium aurantiacum]
MQLDQGHGSRQRVWVGFDIGKGHHWASAVDETGAQVWSLKIVNDEVAIAAAVDVALGLADDVAWAVDVTSGPAGLLLALLDSREQKVRYVPGRTVNAMSAGYRGEAKTDAKDAFMIADISRVRGDFAAIEVPSGLRVELSLLTAHRADLVADRIRLISRLRELLTGVFPVLERAFDYSRHHGALVLLTGYQDPAALRRLGPARLRAWLTKRNVRRADQVAAAALAAAAEQHATLPGQAVAGQIIADLAGQLLALDDRLGRIDRQIAAVFAEHPQADIITSMPGIGITLAAEFVAVAGDLASYPDAGRLASAAGLVPVPRDSGRRTGNLHRPHRYSRRLRRVFYLAAQTSIVRDGPSRDFYLKKRSQGLRHVQAIIALARRRVDVLWALLRDNRPFSLEPPARPAIAA